MAWREVQGSRFKVQGSKFGSAWRWQQGECVILILLARRSLTSLAAEAKFAQEIVTAPAMLL
jgi:hypothetical protein